MMTGLSLNDYFATYVPLIESEMAEVVATAAGSGPASVLGAMLRYHLGFAGVDGSPAAFNSGKRVRPLLTVLCCEAAGADGRLALPAAAAIELLHNFSLIHDDIEDRDELRRGRPTLWKIWGEAQAINAGDAMFALAHLALLNLDRQGVPAGRVTQAMRLFDTTCVALTVGQHLDIAFEQRADVTAADYMAMIEGKTAALTRAACAAGAIVAGAGAEAVGALADFGQWLGMAFQLQDDVLGIWGDPAVTGKLGSDLARGKKTLPVLHAADRDWQVRARYFQGQPLAPADVDEIRRLVEARGGRAYAEQAARDAYLKAMAALDASGAAGPAGDALRLLAGSLLGRAA